MRARLGFSAAVVAALSACGSPPLPSFPSPPVVRTPVPAEVESVVFMVGDAGAALTGRSPLLARLQADVERWSEALGRESAVTVLFLGDNVYPVGVRDRSRPEFVRDTAYLWGQIRVVAGAQALRHGSSGLFLAGNHDWGNATGPEGLRRLRNLEEQLDEARAGGPNVELIPRAGSGGPAVRDIGARSRLMALDTHWFLQGPSEEDRLRFFTRFEEELRAATDRHLLVAAHHPFRSGGPHGTFSPAGEALGLLFLLKKSGTLVQDLNSSVYSELLDGIREAFRRTGRPPLVFAGGHDHSVQVLDGLTPNEPVAIVVSGAGSKSTPVADVEGLRYAASSPGYVTLFILRSGAVDLVVTAGDPERLACPAANDARVSCMERSVASFRPLYSRRLTSAPPG